MSMLPSSASYLASAIKNPASGSETFNKFFQCWIIEQNQHLQDLIAASENQKKNRCASSRDDDQTLRPLIKQVIEHYEHYYRAKARWAKMDVLSMLSPSWTSKFESAFLWIGGWRPSMAFHLLYSKSGLQLEATGLDELLRELSCGDLGDLSPNQLIRVDKLQKRTIKEEKEITEKMARHQETVADSSMVELSHAVSELRRRGETSHDEHEQVESILESKQRGLEDILKKADDLRLRTLKAVIEILSPIQAVHFLIAAAELHLRLHEWGKRRDEDKRRNDASAGTN